MHAVLIYGEIQKMLSKILSLHIANNYLNFLFIEKKWGQINFATYWQRKVSFDNHDNNTEQPDDHQHPAARNSGKWPEIAGIVQAELQKRNLQYDCFLVSFFPQNYFLRFLNFPFCDKNKISRVLSRELEDVLPFELDEFYYDFMLTDTRGQDGCRVMVMGVKKQEIDELLAALTPSGSASPPPLVDTVFAPLVSLCAQMEEPRPERYLFLHFEPGHSLLLCMENKTVIDGHELQWKSLSEQNDNNYEGLISELKSYFIKLNNLRPDFEVEQIIISGQNLHQMARNIEHELSIPVRLIQDIMFKDQCVDQSEIFCFAPNIGLISGFGSKSGLFNFNPEKAQFSSYYKYKDNLKVIILSLAIILITITVSFMYNIHLKENRLNQIYSEMQKIVARNFHDIKGKLTPAQYISLFKARIQTLNSLDLDKDATARVKIVDVLNVISSKIPASLNVQLKSFTADKKHIRLLGTADSFRTVDQIKTSLEGSGLFKRVDIKGAKADEKGQVSFTLAAWLKGEG